jgi:imidazolonepropionase-like amidohydrolase
MFCFLYVGCLKEASLKAARWLFPFLCLEVVMAAIRYLRVGWMFDGKGGPIRRHQLLRLEGGIIAAIEAYRQNDRPDAAITADFSQCTILPPLVDAHVHLFMSGTTDRARRQWQLSASYEQLLPAMSRHAGDFLRCGVLAVRDGGDQGGYALRFRQSPAMPESLLLKVVGRAWHQEGRYGRLIGRSPRPEETLAEAVAGEEQEVDQVKIVNSGYNSLKVYGLETTRQFAVEALRAAVAVASEAGRPVMVHANGREAVRDALLAGCHSIEHGFFMGRENLEMMAARGVFWVPTVYTMKAFLANFAQLGGDAERLVVTRNLDHQLEQLALARQLRVPVALGTDAGSLGVHHGQSLVEELQLFLDAGYSLTEAVTCATAHGAKLLGIRDFGILEKGRAATFLVVPGAPTQLPGTLRSLQHIYLQGTPLTLHC